MLELKSMNVKKTVLEGPWICKQLLEIPIL